MFLVTTAIRKIRKLTKRIKVIQGGTWAGKTYAIIPILIDLAIKNEKGITTIVAETIPALKAGAIRIFKDIMQETGRWVNERWNGQDMCYTFYNKSIIEFKSFDSVGKAKAAGKRDRLFVNEANHNAFDIIDALMIRTDKDVFLDYNPDDEFWAHKELLTRGDTDFLILTYKDNEAVPESILNELNIKMQKAFFDVEKDWQDKSNIKNSYWANWCRVYIQGLIGSLEGVILNNWHVIDNIPEAARLIGRGLDFGYNDPTAIVEVWKHNGKRILNEVCYQSGLTNSLIAKKLDNAVRTFADSAEPKSIEEVKVHGIHNIEGAKKGADSINYGLQLMQGESYLVTSSSINLIKELRGYIRDDKGKPAGTHHAIDAIRYHEMMTLSQPASWLSLT